MTVSRSMCLQMMQFLPFYGWVIFHCGASQVVSGKEPARNAGAVVWSLGQEDSLEEGMATQSSILVWEIPWTEEPKGLQPIGLQKSWTWLNNQAPPPPPVFHCIYIYYQIFFIYSSVDGHLSSFYILAIVNNTAMNMVCIQYSKFLILILYFTFTK